MGQTVEERAGQTFLAERGGPLVERQVRGDDGGAAFIALADQLEQQLGAGLRQRNEAKFVDNQQLVAGELLLQAQEPLLVAGLDEFVNDGGGEAGFDAMLARCQSDADGDMCFTDTAGAKGDDVLAAVDERRAGQVQDQFLLSVGIASKSKLSRLLRAGNLAALMRRSTMRASRSISSASISRAR